MFTLKAKSWQVFLIAMLGLLLGNSDIQDVPWATQLLYVLGMAVYYGWFIVLGNTLADLIPRNTSLSRSWFLVDGLIVLTALCLLGTLSEGQRYSASGVAALPGLYLLFAYVHLLWFPAIALVAIEKDRRPEFGFYFGTFLLILFWPIGLWFVQPRLNRLARTRFE